MVHSSKAISNVAGLSRLCEGHYGLHRAVDLKSWTSGVIFCCFLVLLAFILLIPPQLAFMTPPGAVPPKQLPWGGPELPPPPVEAWLGLQWTAASGGCTFNWTRHPWKLSLAPCTSLPVAIGTSQLLYCTCTLYSLFDR